MEWLFLLPLLALALVLLFPTAVWYLRIAHRHVIAALTALEEDLRNSAASADEGRRRETERKRFERRFARAAGADSSVDHEAVEAAKQMPLIRQVLAKELPETIMRCVRVHLRAASAVGAEYILEVAYEPECMGSRARVVGLASAAMQGLERYPFLLTDEDLMAWLIMLRTHIVPVCSNCPYIEHRLQSAPPLCPTAQIIQKIDRTRGKNAR